MTKPTKRAAKRSTRSPKGSKTVAREKRTKAPREKRAAVDPKQEPLPGMPAPIAPPLEQEDDSQAAGESVKYTLRISAAQDRRVKTLKGNPHVFGVGAPTVTDVIRAAFVRGLEGLEQIGRERAEALAKFPRG